MNFESKQIESIYAGKVAKKYDYSMPPFFLKWKRMAYNSSSLKRGDKVLVFCCGTGLDFPYIIDKIGIEAKLSNVDFSSKMLKVAHEKVKQEKWKNIELIEAGITQYVNNYIFRLVISWQISNFALSFLQCSKRLFYCSRV